ncbi:MAG: hypothetical protein AAF354_14680 [Pseudomonadota bacterium]
MQRTTGRVALEHREPAIARLEEYVATYASQSAGPGVMSGQLKTWHRKPLVARPAVALAQR